MRITTNIPGLRAMQSASIAEKRMELISGRLSSGVRLSSAKDDPAGSATSRKLQMQTDGTKMANQNTLNAISVMQTAEAGLSEIHSILQRMREMSVQASNETHTSNDRLKIQLEIDQLKVEIDTISDRTEYNKTRLLNGHAGLKAKSTDAKVLSMTDNIKPGDYEILVTVQARQAGAAFSFNSGAFPSSGVAGVLSINGIEVEFTFVDTAETAYAKFTEAAAAAAISVKEPPGANPYLVSDYYGAAHTIDINSSNPALLAAFGIGSNGVHAAGVDAKVTLGSGFSPAPDSNYTIDGNRITINDINNQRMVVDIDTGVAVGNTININVSDRKLVFQTGANKDINIEVSLGEISTASLGIDRLSVATIDSAQRAISELDAALSQCSLARGKIGSYENRFELVSTGLENVDLSLQGAQSKIFDTDMAYELAEFSRNQIVAQGAIAIMGQANQRPQNVLQLIK